MLDMPEDCTIPCVPDVELYRECGHAVFIAGEQFYDSREMDNYYHEKLEDMAYVMDVSMSDCLLIGWPLRRT